MASSEGGIDLRDIFGGNDVCLLQDTEDVKTWRVRNVQAKYLNEVRNWLETKLQSVAIAWVHMEENGGIFSDEILAHRLGLIPIAADPMLLDLPIQDSSPQEFNNKATLRFELDVKNQSKEFLRVFSKDLVWKPLGDQAERFSQAIPRVDDEYILLTVLEPGQNLKLSGFATRGTKREHAKWAATNPYFKEMKYRKSPARASPVVLEATVDTSPPAGSAASKAKCAPCDQLAESSFNCFHFTIERVGGLTFEQIGQQLRLDFKWIDGKPPAAQISAAPVSAAPVVAAPSQKKISSARKKTQ